MNEGRKRKKKDETDSKNSCVVMFFPTRHTHTKLGYVRMIRSSLALVAPFFAVPGEETGFCI